METICQAISREGIAKCKWITYNGLQLCEIIRETRKRNRNVRTVLYIIHICIFMSIMHYMYVHVKNIYMCPHTCVYTYLHIM